ncbi:unnamed protein product, partial [Didymodactylos carnosus]
MVENLTPRWSYVKPGQTLAYFDPFSPDFSQPTPNNEAKEGNNSSSVVKQESPKPAPKEGQKHIPNYITEKKFDNYIEKVWKRLLKQDPIAKFIDDSKLRFKVDEYIGEGDFGSCFMLSSTQNPAAYERLDPPNDITIYSLQKTTDVAVFPLVTSSNVDKAEKPLKPSTDTIDTPGDWLSKLDLTSADLTFDQENRLRQLLSNYPDIFSSKPGRTDVVRHHIDVGDSKPIKQGPYRLLNPERKAECSKQTTEMLQNDIAEPSFGPWASPVTLVPKKDDSLRFCIDFRKLNDITIKDTYPIPRIDDTLDALK